MSTSSKRLPRDKALALAERVRQQLAPACNRIEIAGSIRRQAADSGDVELVAIPKLNGLFVDFGNSADQLDAILQKLVIQDKLHRIKSGDCYKQFNIIKAGVNLDLWLCNAETWGVCFTIRTGPASFSKQLVTQQFKGGWLPNDLRVEDLRVWRGDLALPTPEENDFFQLADLTYIEPQNRL